MSLAEKRVGAELCQCNSLKLEDISLSTYENQGAGSCLTRPQKGLNLSILLYKTLIDQNLMSGSVYLFTLGLYRAKLDSKARLDTILDAAFSSAPPRGCEQ